VAAEKEIKQMKKELKIMRQDQADKDAWHSANIVCPMCGGQGGDCQMCRG